MIIPTTIRVRSDQYIHPTDGSWASTREDGRLERGVRTVRWQGISSLRGPLRGIQLDTLLLQTPAVPASMRDFAVAQVGVVDARNVASAATAAGFAQVGPHWVHPDIGWMGHRLHALPYSTETGWR
jgi:hypothetical protein